MKLLKTFPKGGVHPHDHKSPTDELETRNAAVPSRSIIPLSQHLGSPAECVVKPGDTIREETLIGKATGFVSTNIHSPVPGTVKELREIYLPNGARTQAVVVELSGEFDRLGKKRDEYEWENLSKEELLALVSEMGVVGMGGATFPIHVKYTLPKGAKVEAFIVNGAECEPYLTADHRLMVEKTAEIVEGARIAAKILSPGAVYIGIEANKPDAIRAMEATVERGGLPFRVVPLKLKYPQGDEKQLIKAITGREVPSGKLPLDAGAVVSNVGTVFAVYEAVALRKPLTERVVTVSGGAVAHPANLKVKIGTTFGELIDECGGFARVPAKIVAGGPMMGFAVYDLDTPVTKGTSGILALTKEELADAERTACLQCGRCIASCPMGLNPTRLFKWIDHEEYGTAVEEGLLDCRECGSCSYICPAHIPLVQGLRVGKKISRKKKA